MPFLISNTKPKVEISGFIKQCLMVFMGILNLLRRGWEPFDFAIYCKIETLSAFLIFLVVGFFDVWLMGF